MANKISRYKHKTSKYMGVHWDKRNQKWCAEITIDKKTISLGYFDKSQEKQAGEAYKIAALKLGRKIKTNDTNPYRIVDGIAHIELSQGKEAKISIRDLNKVIKYTWSYDKRLGARSKLGKKSGPDILLHRFILGFECGKIYPVKVWHKDGDKLNCLRRNLQRQIWNPDELGKIEPPDFTFNQIKTVTFQAKQIRYVNINREKFFVFKDILKALNRSTSVGINSDYVIKRLELSTEYGTMIYKTRLMNKDMLVLLLSKTRSHHVKELLEFFGCNTISRIKEIEYCGILSEIYKDYLPIPQYSCETYRIDLYISKVKLAIECDERNHKDRDKSYETIRQTNIQKKLGCKFYRFDPDHKEFNIGKVIYDINKLIKKGVG
jgi:hypothetical protein